MWVQVQVWTGTGGPPATRPQPVPHTGIVGIAELVVLYAQLPKVNCQPASSFICHYFLLFHSLPKHSHSSSCHLKQKQTLLPSTAQQPLLHPLVSPLAPQFTIVQKLLLLPFMERLPQPPHVSPPQLPQPQHCSPLSGNNDISCSFSTYYFFPLTVLPLNGHKSSSSD